MNPAFFHDFSRRVLLAAAVCVAWLCAQGVALPATATNRPAARGPGDRYLLIVDTSSAMERNAENTQRLVGQLVSSGMVGQARTGDTVGIWTFSDELKTGGFPVQRWTPQTRERISAAVVEFLGKHPYEKKSRFEKVAETLTSVVKDSDRITVLIVTDGSQKITGTPFDQEINESYQLNRATQRKERMPFLTVLRAKGGEYIGWRVNSPPFRPEFPPFPVEPKTAEPPVGAVEPKPEPKPESKPALPPPATGPSLIVVREPPAAATNHPVSPVANPATTVTTTVQPPPAETAPPKTAIDAGPRVDKPVEQVKSDPGTPASTVAPKPPADPPQAKVDVPPPETKPADTSAGPPSLRTPASEPDVSDSTQTAVATPAESLFNRTNLLVAGVVLLVAACGLFLVLMRRAARPAGKVSLITSSMDNDEKHL